MLSNNKVKCDKIQFTVIWWKSSFIYDLFHFGDKTLIHAYENFSPILQNFVPFTFYVSLWNTEVPSWKADDVVREVKFTFWDDGTFN